MHAAVYSYVINHVAEVNPDPIRVSIAGASGYSGTELLKLLVRHPGVRIERLYAASSAGRRCDELYPSLRGRVEMVYEPMDAIGDLDADLLFVALPSGHAVDVIAKTAAAGARVIDLGGDFRLDDADVYARYYGRDHGAPSMLGTVPYGLPEWNRTAIAGAPLVANPGCYPTSILLPLLPLVRDGIVAPEWIAASALSGVSGAGRASSVELSYTEMHGNVRAYRVGAHQHTPEITTMLRTLAGRDASVTFIPHLAPIARGIYSTIATRLAPGAGASDVAASFSGAYADSPFVRWSDTAIPELSSVVGTNFIDIGYRVDGATGDLVILSTIDNLIKGAAGQAIQNMNIMFGHPETEGLL
jgi:N-acetyl-gamma-glutamyl-phosphate reductase